MQQELIALDAVVQHHRRVPPLAQPRILVLEAEIFLVDREDLADRAHPAVEADKRRAHHLQRGRGPVGHRGASTVKEGVLRLADQDEGDGKSGEKRDGELRSAAIPRDLPGAVRHDFSNPATGRLYQNAVDRT